MAYRTHAPKLAVLAALLLWSGAAHAASDPNGIWFDQDKNGAVEIKPCDSGVGVCGYVVYVFDPANAKNCGMQILNEVTPDGGGWIYSPKRKNHYDVRLKRLSDDKLRVVGNANSRFFSRTFTWNRAPDNLLKCGQVAAAKSETTTKTDAAPVGDEVKLPAADPAAAETTTKTEPETKAQVEPAKAETTEPETTDDEGSSGKRKTCKYRIPYINRTISAPCRR